MLRATPVHPARAGRPARLSMSTPASPRLADLLPRYEAALVGEKRRPRGVQRYMWTLRRFARWLGPDPRLDALTPDRLQRYQETIARAGSASTVGNALSAVRSFCRWCVRSGLRADDPTALLRRPRKAPTVPRALRVAQLRGLLAAIVQPEGLCDDQAARWPARRRAVYLMLYAGLRQAETAMLRWEHVDLDRGVLIVRDGKGGKDRSIPIAGPLRDELARVPLEERLDARAVVCQPGGKAYSIRSIEHIFSRWLPRQGIAGLSAHQLRHTFASELLRCGADLKQIQELLGHASVATTERYLLLDPDRLREAVNRLPHVW